MQRMHWSRLRDLFRQARDGAGEIPEGWLLDACGDDADVARILRELLEAAASQRDDPLA
jgi:hypothetical protein